MLSACNNNSEYNDSESQYEPSQAEKYATIESTRKYIENTTWTYTERGANFWYKLEFKNGKVYEYMSFPAKGEWGEPYKIFTSYEIEERRFSDTGEKFIAVSFYEEGESHSYCSLAPKQGSFKILFDQYDNMKPTDYVWD